MGQGRPKDEVEMQCLHCGEIKQSSEFRWNPRTQYRTECMECEKSELRCSSCLMMKEHDKFPPSRQSSTGRHSLCNECHAERMKARWWRNPEVRERAKKRSRTEAEKRKRIENYRRTKKNREEYARYRQWNYHNNPSEKWKVAARRAVRHAKLKGELSAPNHCELCGKKTKRIEAHHKYGYWPKEAWLAVQWLCPSCHTNEDIKQRDRGFVLLSEGLDVSDDINEAYQYTKGELGVDDRSLFEMALSCSGRDEIEVFLKTAKMISQIFKGTA